MSKNTDRRSETNKRRWKVRQARKVERQMEKKGLNIKITERLRMNRETCWKTCWT